MRRLLVKIGAWLAILLGLAMMLQPTAAEWLPRRRNSKTAQQFAANTATAAAFWGWIPAARVPSVCWPSSPPSTRSWSDAACPRGRPLTNRRSPGLC